MCLTGQAVGSGFAQFRHSPSALPTARQNNGASLGQVPLRGCYNPLRLSKMRSFTVDNESKKRIVFKEFFRKIIHICAAFVPLFLKFTFWPVIIFLVFMAILYSASEICRLKGKSIPLISKITSLAARDSENNHFVAGPLFMVFGILFSILVFPQNCAVSGIFALAFGDGFASLIGRSFGKIKIPFLKNKTVEGCSACFLAVFISVLCLSRNLPLSLLIAVFTTLIEALPLGALDNFFIPVVISAIYMLLNFLL